MCHTENLLCVLTENNGMKDKAHALVERKAVKEERSQAVRLHDGLKANSSACYLGKFPTSHSPQLPHCRNEVTIMPTPEGRWGTTGSRHVKLSHCLLSRCAT